MTLTIRRRVKHWAGLKNWTSEVKDEYGLKERQAHFKDTEELFSVMKVTLTGLQVNTACWQIPIANEIYPNHQTQTRQFSVMKVDHVLLTALRLLESVAFTPTSFMYDGTGKNVAFGRFLLKGRSACWRTLCYPEISRETKTKKPPPQPRESRE